MEWHRNCYAMQSKGYAQRRKAKQRNSLEQYRIAAEWNSNGMAERRWARHSNGIDERG